MAEIEVPDFKSIDDFVKWSDGLSEKAIQSWKTDDWLKMYEKIDAYIESDDFYKFYKKYEKHLFDKGKLKTYNPTGAIDIAIGKRLFTHVCREEMGKIYRNYRFEPEQSKYIREIAKHDGEKLATMQFDAAALAISDSDEAIINKLQTIGNITREGTHYGATLETGFIDTSFRIDRSISSANTTPVGRGVGILRFHPKAFVDGKVSVAFHEYAHIYKQVRNPLQKELAEKGILAHPELGKNFHKLMEKNGEYYISGKMIQSLIDELRWTSSFHNKNKLGLIFNNYHKQPMERYSNMYGVIAERAFRATSGQTSERNAMRVADIIGGSRGMPDLPDFTNDFIIKRPAKAVYTPEGIKLRYEPPNGYGVGDIEEKIKRRFLGADEKMMQRLKFSKSETLGYFDVVVPGDYSFSLQLNKFERNSLRVSLPPVGEMAAANVPPLSNELHTGATDVPLSSVEESKALSQAREATATASAKMEEKLATRGGAEVAKQVIAETAKKKTGLLAKAAAANAKFDKAVDTAIEKGAQKLNNSKVGQAYKQAATKVGNTKTGKAVANVTKTAAKKVANTAVGKATGKVVGKVVSKTVGTAVGKSVLKKIPLVSAAAGAYFAYDRIKNGEWGAACCEFASGVAGCFPGVGTAVSVGLDTGLAANDIHQAVKGMNMKEKMPKTSAPTKKYVAKAQPKPVKQPPQTQSKKIVQKTTLNPKLARQQNGRA